MTHHNSIAKLLSILRMITGPISAIASALIIMMIARSTQRFSTTLHRLLVGLSVSDILVSTAMSLASIPMPVGTPDVWMPLGNTQTCEAQGFVIALATTISPCLNAGICIFFLLKVRFTMSDEVIRTKVEPFLFILPIILGLTCGIYGIKNEYFNPSVSLCYFEEYPIGCHKAPDVPCERGSDLFGSWFLRFAFFVIFVLVPVAIFSSMTNIFCKVRNQEEQISRFGRGSLTNLSRDESRSPTSSTTPRRGISHYYRLVIFRALSYTAAWLLTYLFPLILMVVRLSGSEPSDALRILNAFFYPLQGLFNFIVFIYPRLMRIRRMYPSYSPRQLLMGALMAADGELSPNTPPQRNRNNSMVVRAVEDIEVGGNVDITELREKLRKAKVSVKNGNDNVEKVPTKAEIQNEEEEFSTNEDSGREEAR